MKKGILERLLYMAIGATFTLLIVLLVDSKNWKKDNIDVAKVETTEETTENEIAEEKLVTTEPLLDFEEEAEEKLKELQEKQQVTETETQTQTEEIKESISANSIEAAKVKWIKDYPRLNSEKTLEEKQSERTSYEETLATNAFDKKVIENSKIDFSDVKIAILGDSITEASNLPDEDQAKYAYPVKLQEILGCKEIYNLGIGGSTVSRKGGHSLVERWRDVPDDSDIIIVFGGSNDCLFENKWDYGELEYEHRMTEGTFCGDLDEMLGGMEYSFRNHNEDSYIKLLYVNPPSTILNDGVYAIDPGNMVKQEEFAKAINEIAPTYSFEVIDLYNNNLFNSHDKDINEKWITDGIHPNAEGYQMIAEHLASQIIQRIEQ